MTEPTANRYRIGVGLLTRVSAAAFGGYALAVVVSGCLSHILPMARADAVLTGLLVSFAVYVGAVIWAFAVRSLRRMLWGLGAAAAGFGVLLATLSPIVPP